MRRVLGIFAITVTFIAASLFAMPSTLLAQTPPSAGAGGFEKKNFFGIWSKNAFADAITVTGPSKMIFLSGMGSEDETDGKIRYQGDFLAQCRYAYAKIKNALAQHGAAMKDVVKITAYLTDVRMRPDYAKCRAEAVGDGPLSTHTFLNVTQLAWPGMLVEVDVTAMVAQEATPR